MDAACAQIAAAFGTAGEINDVKRRVEHVLRAGPDHPAARARFGARVELLASRGLDDAVTTAERWWRSERKAFQIASALGRHNRLSLDVLRELRLVLRLLRFKRMDAECGAIAAALCGESFAAAAE
jgi:hypothetical protein